jgi:hypothetical protein
MMSALMILQKGSSGHLKPIVNGWVSRGLYFRLLRAPPQGQPPMHLVSDHPVFGSEDAEVKAASGMPVLGARLLRVSNLGDAILYSVYQSTYSV